MQTKTLKKSYEYQLVGAKLIDMLIALFEF